MERINVNTLFFNHRENSNLIQPFLFQVSKYFSCNGQRVLYIAPEAISALPATINNAEVVTDPEIMRLVSFLYLPTQGKLLDYLNQIHLVPKPPTAIVVQDMERFSADEEDTMLGSSLLHAASICGQRLQSPATLIVSYKSSIPPIIADICFFNVWRLEKDKDVVTLKKLENVETDNPTVFKFSSDSSNFSLTHVFGLSFS